jgi:protein-S-isoprenylcysteine O-methyltransferase Ste14
MSKRSFVERLRIIISRGIVACIFALLLVNESKWDLVCPWISMTFFSIGVFLAGIGALGRLWCSVYIAGFKTQKLITMGPYSMMRNPLYFFSLLGAIGLGLASETITIPVLIVFSFAVYYPFVIKSEEKKLRALHGVTFDAYCAKVPRFWPKQILLNEPEEYTVNPKIYRGHIASALWFIWILGVLELIESLHSVGVLPVLFHLP